MIHMIHCSSTHVYFRCKYDSCNINDEDVSPAYLDSLLVYHQGRISRDSISWWFLVGGGALVCQSNSLGQVGLEEYRREKVGLEEYMRGQVGLEEYRRGMVGLGLYRR